MATKRKPPTSVRLGPVDESLLTFLSKELGMSKGQVLKRGLHLLNEARMAVDPTTSNVDQTL